MKRGIPILLVMLVIALVWTSGCSNVSMGDLKAGNVFGASSPEQQDMMQCFVQKYGDPRTATSPAFIGFTDRQGSVLFTTNLVNETPVDKVTGFSKDTTKIYYWAFYKGFTKGDVITMQMMYSSGSSGTQTQVVNSSQVTDGQYGAVYGSVEKPDTGWPVGRYEVDLYANRARDISKERIASASGTVDVTNGATATTSLPCGAGSSSSGGPGTGVCTPGYTSCSGICVDTQTDKNNCGSCGTPCGSGKSCFQGACHSSAPQIGCPTGKTKCSGACFDLQTDQNNCGSCGRVCGTGKVCSQGVCRTDVPQLSCNTGETKCSGACFDLQIDQNNCGSCGHGCNAGYHCVNGGCQSGGGQVNTGGPGNVNNNPGNSE